MAAGDHLAAVAERFDVSVAELRAANNLPCESIEVGQRLAITAGPSAAQPKFMPDVPAKIAAAGAVLQPDLAAR